MTHVRVLLLLALCLLARPGLAESPAPVVVPSGTARVDMSGGIAVLDDRDGAMTIDEVAAAPERFSLKPRLPTGGFFSGASWRMFSLANPAQDETRLLVEVQRAFLNFIDAYVADGKGGFLHYQGGNRRPFGARPIPYREFVFPVALPAGATTTVFVRVHSDTAMVIDVNVWNADAFAIHAIDDALYGGVLLGIGLIVIALVPAIALALRGGAMVWLLVHMMCFELRVLTASGYLHQFALPNSPFAAEMIGKACIGFAAAAGMMFLSSTLDIPRHFPRTARLGRVFTGLSLGVGVVPAIWPEGQVAPLTNFLAITWCGLSIAILIACRRRRVPSAGILLCGMALALVLIALRVGRNIGLPVPSEMAEWGLQVGFDGYALFLALAVVNMIRSIQEEKRDVTARLLKATELREHELAETVSHRTAELEQSRREIEAALVSERQMMKQQRDFLSMVSHEFKTPMSIVLASVSNLSECVRGGDASGECDENLDDIVGAIGRMRQMVDKFLVGDWLDQAGGMRPRMAKVDLVAILAGVVKDHGVIQPDRNIDLRRDVETCVLIADAALLTVMISNVVDNAMKYSPELSPVEIRLSVQDDHALIQISDQGRGISDDDIEFIFDKYYRSPKEIRKPGTGLGLHIVRGIAELHGGQVAVRRGDGGGSVFSIRLPRPGAGAGGNL